MKKKEALPKSPLKKQPKKPSRHNGLLFILGICAVGICSSAAILGAFNSIEVAEPVATEKTKETLYPKQYSDAHITQNAVVTDERFKNSVVLEKKNSFVSFLANVFSTLEKPNVQKSDGSENGTWLWTPILEITPEYRDSIISEAKKNGITSIYLSIDSYLDIYSMETGPEKDNLKNDFDEALATFVTKAHENEISVDAEGGWRNWAETGNAYKAFATVNYAIDFNKTHTEKLRGFQYDVEPYLLDEYQKNKAGDRANVLGNYVNLVDETVEWLRESDLQLSVVVPEFYDGTNAETPKFFYAGKTTYTIEHLLTILDRRPESKVIIMSYRNWTLGQDGSIDVSTNEINAANKHATKVVIAQETGDVKPSYVTFYNTSRQYYKKQVSTLKNTFSVDKSFGGIATHYVNAFMELK